MNFNHHRKILKLVFWVCLFSFFTPLAGFFYFESKLNQSADSSNLKNDWEVWAGDSQQYLETINLPINLKKQDLKKSDAVEQWVLKKKLFNEDLLKYKRPTLVLGRIGDADKVYFNDCLIGSTGIDQDDKIKGYWWAALRMYEIPLSCINKNEKANNLEVMIYKFLGPSRGIFKGPIALGEHDVVFSLGKIIEWFRFDILSIFGGIFILGLTIYYLFVYLLIPARIEYGVFGLLTFFVGLFEIITGELPYRYIGNTNLVLQVCVLSALVSSALIITFFNIKMGIKKSLLEKIVYGINGVLGLIVLFQSNHQITYKLYETWFTFFILINFIVYFQLIRWYANGNKTEGWKYVVGFSTFMLCALFDIFATITGVANVYLIPYGFASLAGAVSLALAQESADAFLNVEIKVDERTRDLAKAMEELKSLDQYKERFFANISHDFKTPITVAMGAVEQLKTMITDVGQSKMILTANRSLNQLLNMVGDILNLAKAKSGQLKLQWQSAPIAKLLESWLEPQEVLCKQKGITLEYDFSSYAPLHIPMDVKNMERVIQNLMSNAIKFTQAKKDGLKKIKVELLTDGSKMSLIISDSGIGIPDDEKAKVFERFVQSSRTDAKEHGGTGIGLSFVKEIIDLHLGKILVKDSEFGGTTIVLEIPLTQNQELLETYSLEEKSKINLTGSLDVTYPPSNPSVKKEGLRSVLIAEDNPEVAQIIYSSLQDQYNVYFARDGQEALERLKNENFDCLLSDINMPRMQGDQLLGEVRKMPKKRNMPIVMLSSKGDDETVVELLNKGANDFVSKPFKKEVLIARIKTQIEGYYIARWIAKNERLIEMGMLASGMAHQIKNGLNNIRNQINYVFRSAISMIENAQRKGESVDLNTKERIEVSAEHARRGLDRIQNLTESISAYTSGSRQKVSISIKDSIKLVQTLQADEITKTNMNIIVDPSVENLKVMGYATVHEVFMNVITNALDACKNISNPQILIKGYETENHVVVLIKDNGHGIEPVVLENLCQPFFTTKAPGEGTGLGLYLVRDFVEVQHAGEFKIESDGKDKGTEITIKLAKIAPDPVRESKMTMHNVSV